MCLLLITSYLLSGAAGDSVDSVYEFYKRGDSVDHVYELYKRGDEVGHVYELYKN